MAALQVATGISNQSASGPGAGRFFHRRPFFSAKGLGMRAQSSSFRPGLSVLLGVLGGFSLGYQPYRVSSSGLVGPGIEV